MKKIEFNNKTVLNNKQLFTLLIGCTESAIETGINNLIPANQYTAKISSANQLLDFLESYSDFTDSVFGGNEYFESYLDDYYINQLKCTEYEILTKHQLRSFKSKSASLLSRKLEETNNIVYVSDGLQVSLVEMSNVHELPDKKKIGKNFEFNVLVRSNMEFSIAYIHLSIIESALGTHSNLYQIEGDTRNPQRLVRAEYFGNQSRYYEDTMLLGSLLKNAA